MTKQYRTFLLLALGTLMFLVSFLSTTALAAELSQSFSGSVSRIGQQAFLSTKTYPGQIFRLSAVEGEAQTTLSKLSSGDNIAGSATFDLDHKTAQIQSIDFVGLRRLIGVWDTNSSGLINFKSYDDMDMLLLSQNNMGLVTTKKFFKYTLTPSNGNEWVLFLSHLSETQMGLIFVKEDSATLKMLHPQTGQVTNTIELRRF